MLSLRQGELLLPSQSDDIIKVSQSKITKKLLFTPHFKQVEKLSGNSVPISDYKIQCITKFERFFQFVGTVSIIHQMLFK